jgi:hypothetical protein
MLNNHSLTDDLREFIENAKVPGTVVMDGAEESISLTIDEMTVKNIDLLIKRTTNHDIRNLVIGADDEQGHEYLAVDFFDDASYLGRGIIVDQALVRYKKFGQGWQNVEVSDA